MANITVLGGGSFGISLALLAQQNEHNVSVWCHSESEANELSELREHKRLLPNIKIDERILITNDLTVTKNADLVIIAVPSFAVESVAKQLKGVIGEKTIVANVAKGIHLETLKPFSEVIAMHLENNAIVALSGPSHAEEVARRKATLIVASSKDMKAAEKVQEWLSNSTMRIYTNDDILGVELGGALKNVMALAVGILDGLELGDNSKAALMTRGMKEISRLGVKIGAKEETFSGLSGIGDLIVTCTSEHSRNRRAGILIGKGASSEEAVKQVGTVEGYSATKSGYLLAKEKNVEMPIVNEMYDVLFNGCDINQVVEKLMSRPTKNESEQHWIGN